MLPARGTTGRVVSPVELVAAADDCSDASIHTGVRAWVKAAEVWWLSGMELDDLVAFVREHPSVPPDLIDPMVRLINCSAVAWKGKA